MLFPEFRVNADIGWQLARSEVRKVEALLLAA
jgi:hypothetical protein